MRISGLSQYSIFFMFVLHSLSANHFSLRTTFLGALLVPPLQTQHFWRESLRPYLGVLCPRRSKADGPEGGS